MAPCRVSYGRVASSHGQRRTRQSLSWRRFVLVCKAWLQQEVAAKAQPQLRALARQLDVRQWVAGGKVTTADLAAAVVEQLCGQAGLQSCAVLCFSRKHGEGFFRWVHLSCSHESHYKVSLQGIIIMKVIARSHCKESLQGVIARSHCKESLQGVIARSHCKESLQGVMARSHGKESWQGVIARSHCKESCKESLQGVIARSHCKES